MNSSRILALLFFITVLTGCGGAEKIRFSKGEVKINDLVIPVEVAVSPKERQRGLMYRKKLDEDRGMLFVFETEQKLSFWMKDTTIPLSIAYINKEGIIKEILSMEPLSRQSVPSRYSVMYALEVNQGFFKEHGIVPGDRVIMNY